MFYKYICAEIQFQSLQESLLKLNYLHQANTGNLGALIRKLKQWLNNMQLDTNHKTFFFTRQLCLGKCCRIIGNSQQDKFSSRASRIQILSMPTVGCHSFGLGNNYSMPLKHACFIIQTVEWSMSAEFSRPLNIERKGGAMFIYIYQHNMYDTRAWQSEMDKFEDWNVFQSWPKQPVSTGMHIWLSLVKTL